MVRANLASLQYVTPCGHTIRLGNRPYFRSSSTSSNPLHINADRLNTDLHKTCEWGAAFRTGPLATKTGMNRLALNDDDARVRRWFLKETESLGCTVTVDKMGNMFAVKPGKNVGAPTAIGSHLDTQPSGGRYDGILGIHAGIESLRVLDENKYQTNFPVAVVNWTNEEGARFPKSMVGSAVWAGNIPLQDAWALKEVGGGNATMHSELLRIGSLGDVDCSYKANPLAAHFELHIEQGPILEAAHAQIGVVLGGQAYRWYTLVIDGQECHTGATPFYSRSDALLCAARIIVASNDIAQKWKGLASTGILTLRPGSTNTVPGRVVMSLDIRHPDARILDAIDDEIQATARMIANSQSELGCQISWTKDFESPAIAFSEECISAVREAAKNTVKEGQCIELYSGAGHDSCSASKRCPASMIFIPCRNGVSHNPREYASPEDCAGAQVLLNAVLWYDKQRKE